MMVVTRIQTALRRILFVVGVFVLGLTGTWLFVERGLATFTPPGLEEAFRDRSIGLETLPLKYALVLEEVSGAAFRTGSEDGRSLWQTYGFIDNPRAGGDAAPACIGNAAAKLPLGIAVSHYMPVTAVQTPVPFAGLSCATCHSAVLRDAAGRTSRPILGAGNPELDVIAWSDGVRSAVLDPTLDADRILAAYDARCGNEASLYDRTIGRLLDRVVIGAWLAGIRRQVGDDLSRYDLPFHGPALNDPRAIPAGPARTRPFRSVVRVALNLPGAENMALSKIPAVFDQDRRMRPASQYDGSIADPVTRSMIAAYASGASAEALSRPEIVQDIRQAAAYTEQLAAGIPVPSFRELFPAQAPDPRRVAAGLAVYMRHCNGCHGNRPSEEAAWSLEGAADVHRLSAPAPASGGAAVGTDPARLNFRYAGMLPLAIWTGFPGWAGDLAAQKEALGKAQAEALRDDDLAATSLWQRQESALELLSRKYRLGHPFNFPREEVRYNLGYVNNPIPRVFLRAPFLHNASVPTLRQLINLDPRPSVFCRGQNPYDPVAIGYDAPQPGPDGRCPPRMPFRFDTSMPGNGNGGHDFPWSFSDPGRDVGQLEDLLAYLRTL